MNFEASRAATRRRQLIASGAAALQVTACILVQTLAMSAAMAQTTSGDKWVRQGLVASEASIRTPMLGGEFEQDSGYSVSADGNQLAYELVRADIENNVNICSLWLMKKGDQALKAPDRWGASVRSGIALHGVTSLNFPPTARSWPMRITRRFVIEHPRRHGERDDRARSRTRGVAGIGAHRDGYPGVRVEPDRYSARIGRRRAKESGGSSRR